MAKVTLPKTNQTGPNEWADVEDNDVALREGTNAIATEQLGEEIVTAAKIAAAAKPFKWYTPKIIATEQSKESTSFATMSTADEIASVVLPENGLIQVAYTAKVKKSVGSTTGIAIFLGANQLKMTSEIGTAVQEAAVGSETNALYQISTAPSGLTNAGAGFGDVTTGQVLGGLLSSNQATAGVTTIFAAAGTYTITIKFKASSGSITAKERRLYVWTSGV